MKHVFLFLLLSLPFLATAQDDYYKNKPVERTYTITLKDGTQLRGELVRQDSAEAIIRTRNLGEVRVQASQIVRMEQVGAETESETGIYPNIFSQTMRLSPTAFSAEKGRLYYQNYFLYFSQFEYGISDNISVGTTFFTFLPTALFSLNAKFTAPVGQRVRLGIQAQYASIGADGILFNGINAVNARAGLGYLQGIVTTGDRQNNTTFGLGWSVSNGELSRNVVGTFGLVRKVSPRLSFITENFVLFGAGSVSFAGVLSGGIRFDRRRHAFDLAAYVPVVIGRNVSSTFFLIPFASYHLRFGQ